LVGELSRLAPCLLHGFMHEGAEVQDLRQLRDGEVAKSKLPSSNMASGHSIVGKMNCFQEPISKIPHVTERRIDDKLSEQFNLRCVADVKQR